MTCAGTDVLVPPIDPAELPEVVTLDEAAALLGWTRQATVDAAAAGRLPVATFGRSVPAHWRFLRDGVCRHRG